MKKRCNRRPVLVRPPPGLRKKLSADKLRDLSIAHNETLDALARGGAGIDTLWHMVEAAYLWSYVAEVEQAGVPEMVEHLNLVRAVLDRYERTGRVGFSGLEYQQARDGVAVMDQLAALTDQTTAESAALYSEAICDSLHAAQARAVA